MRFVVLAAAAAVALGAPGLSRRYRWVAMGVAILLLALGEVVVGRVLARRRAARLPRPGEVKDPAGPRGTA